MPDFEKYLTEITGSGITTEPLDTSPFVDLPNYFNQKYDFKKATLFDQNIIFAFRKTDESFTTGQYRKHLDYMLKVFKTTVVFVFDRLESYNRNRLIKKQIPFVVPFRQLFIPRLIINLTEISATPVKNTKYLSPAAQCLLLYHLQVKAIENYPLKEIAAIMNYKYSSMTISRIARELEAKEICELSGTKEKFFVFHNNGLTLWQQAKQFCETPVKDKVFTDLNITEYRMKKAGLSALSEYGDIADSKIPQYAIYYKDFIRLKKESVIKQIDKHEGKLCLEIWKYDPGLLSITGIVDQLSLLLSLSNIGDPRVETETEKLTGAIEW